MYNNLTVVVSKFFIYVSNKFIIILRKIIIQIEVEKLNFDLKKKYKSIGLYIVQQNQINNTTDFSHDKECLNKVEKIIKLKKYIADRKNSKDEI